MPPGFRGATLQPALSCIHTDVFLHRRPKLGATDAATPFFVLFQPFRGFPSVVRCTSTSTTPSGTITSSWIRAIIPGTPPEPRRIRLLCHRNFGVGSDGILWGPVPTAKARVRPAHLQPGRLGGGEESATVSGSSPATSGTPGLAKTALASRSIRPGGVVGRRVRPGTHHGRNGPGEF